MLDHMAGFFRRRPENVAEEHARREYPPVKEPELVPL
jgi:hypothetical protein